MEARGKPRIVARWKLGAQDWRPKQVTRSDVWIYEAGNELEFHLNVYNPDGDGYVGHIHFRVPRKKLNPPPEPEREPREEG